MKKLGMRLIAWFLYLFVLGACQDIESAPSISLVQVPDPVDISGVAAVPGGYAVVGDDTEDYGRIWPSGDRWTISPKVKGPESVDVGFGPQGKELWLVLGEKNRTLRELNGPQYTFPEKYEQVCGRGLEGLAVRWQEGKWEVAVSWEGGFYRTSHAECKGKFAIPKIAVLQWKSGEGTQGPEHEFEVTVPIPNEGRRFRATDLVWAGDEVLVLLQSTKTKQNHTWLQKFDLQGKQVGEPKKLEKDWGSFQKGKKWSAMDWTLDGTSLVLGYDNKSSPVNLIVIPYP